MPVRENAMEKNKHLPDMSLYEASDFWDEHEFGEFDDVQEVQDLRFALKKKKYVGIDMEIYSIITTMSKQLHTTEDHLINEWLSEKVNA